MIYSQLYTHYYICIDASRSSLVLSLYLFRFDPCLICYPSNRAISCFQLLLMTCSPSVASLSSTSVISFPHPLICCACVCTSILKSVSI
ncbi:hypothetical protein CW304_26155 [Bacillus sp. UFRGS-B20]|nr:hypothetical protein CW304_26155 [Bacillus sp. UFRGS-B20]